jgi:hypothetical protein
VCIIYDPVRSVQGTIALKARAPRGAAAQRPPAALAP